MTGRPDPDPRAIARAYRAAHAALDERPSEAARAAILAAAARAVESRPHAAGSAPRRRWRFPLAAAATILVSSIAVIVAQRTEQQMPAGVTADRAPSKVSGQGAEPGPTGQPATEIRPVEPPPASAVVQVPARRDRQGAVARNAPAPEPSPPVGKPAPHEQAADTTAREATAAAGATAADGREPSRPAAAARMQAAPAPARDAQATDVEQQSAAGAESAAATAEDPERWLARIIELRRAGRDDEADAELKKLRERYSQLTIPEAALRRAGTR